MKEWEFNFSKHCLYGLYPAIVVETHIIEIRFLSTGFSAKITLFFSTVQQSGCHLASHHLCGNGNHTALQPFFVYVHHKRALSSNPDNIALCKTSYLRHYQAKCTPTLYQNWGADMISLLILIISLIQP